MLRLRRLIIIKTMTHSLDDAYNDGAVWFADVDPSYLTNERLEFIIPLEAQENYEGDHISRQHRDIYDMYVLREEYLRPSIADALVQWSRSEGYRLDINDPTDANEVISKFEVFHVYIEEGLGADACEVGIVFSTEERPARTVIVDIDLVAGKLTTRGER